PAQPQPAEPLEGDVLRPPARRLPGRRAAHRRAGADRRAGATRRPPSPRAGGPKKSTAAAAWPAGLKREVVMSLIQEYPARLVCRLLGFPRCQLYRPADPRPDPDAELRQALVRLAGQWPTYGYRRLTAMLKREGFVANSKRVRRLMD